MSSNITFIAAVGIILQYILIGLIYLFLWRVITLAWRDFRQNNNEEAEPNPEPLLARLVAITAVGDDLPGKIYNIGDSLSIGRSEGNDIVINDAFVSSEHACITARRYNYVLTDLSSTNGTYLNERKIESDMQIAPGDHILIGPVTFKFER